MARKGETLQRGEISQRGENSQEGELPRLQTKVRLFHNVRGNRELLGFADLTIGGAFVIRGICIVRALNGEDPGDPFVSFPSKKGTGAKEGQYFDIAHPITAEAHHRASEAILRAYEEAAASH